MTTSRARVATALALFALTGAVACSSGHSAADPAASSPAPSASTTAPAAAVAPAAPRSTPAAVGSATHTAPTLVKAATNPCTANRHAKFVSVSLTQQRMWMCAKHTVAYTSAVTTGMAGPDTRTPTGNFHIQGLNRNSVLTLDTGKQYDVKYWIPFNAPLFGFHDSPWQKFPYGSPQYRTDGSHGCVHMPLKAIKFLYGWADIGTPVHIGR